MAGLTYELITRRRVVDMNISKIDAHLFRDEHRHGRIGALSHLDLRHDENHLAIAGNTHEGIRREDVALRCVGHAVRQADAQQEPAADSGAGAQKRPAGYSVFGVFEISLGETKTIHQHDQPLCP